MGASLDTHPHKRSFFIPEKKAQTCWQASGICIHIIQQQWCEGEEKGDCSHAEAACFHMRQKLLCLMLPLLCQLMPTNAHQRNSRFRVQGQTVLFFLFFVCKAHASTFHDHHTNMEKTLEEQDSSFNAYSLFATDGYRPRTSRENRIFLKPVLLD